jgi:hypothetical protein
VTAYFPFLKAKQGEFRALAALDPITRSRLTPVIELLPASPPRQKADRPSKDVLTIDEQVTKHVRSIAQASSTCHRVLIDFTHFTGIPTTDGRHPAGVIMSELQSRRVLASPVVRPSMLSLPLVKALNDAACMRNGLTLRLAPTDFDYPPEHIDIVLSSLHVKMDHVDVIIDFGAIGDAGALRRGMMRAALSTQAKRGWRSLTVGGASFPASLKEYGEGEYRFPRLEWEAWLALAADRALGFADYGMRDAAPPVEGGVAPIPNLRYMTGDEWLVLKAKAADNALYSDLAFKLTRSSAWQGASHCAGCAALERCAHGDKGKTAAQAIQFGMTHHLTCVTQQLASSGADASVP